MSLDLRLKWVVLGALWSVTTVPLMGAQPCGGGGPTLLQVYNVHADHLGSPELQTSDPVATNTDGNGVFLRRLSTPYGTEYAQQSIAPLDPSFPAFGFTDHEYDSESGLYYMRARYYDASVGRFLSPDPALNNGGDSFERIIGIPQAANAYSYVDNQPTVTIDPTGETPIGTTVSDHVASSQALAERRQAQAEFQQRQQLFRATPGFAVHHAVMQGFRGGLLDLATGPDRLDPFYALPKVWNEPSPTTGLFAGLSVVSIVRPRTYAGGPLRGTLTNMFGSDGVQTGLRYVRQVKVTGDLPGMGQFRRQVHVVFAPVSFDKGVIELGFRARILGVVTPAQRQAVMDAVTRRIFVDARAHGNVRKAIFRDLRPRAVRSPVGPANLGDVFKEEVSRRIIPRTR